MFHRADCVERNPRRADNGAARLNENIRRFNAAYCYFPMPFKKKAKITLENQHANKITAFFYQVDYCLYEELPDDITYFHAQWRRERLTEKQKDYTILDGVKGKGFLLLYLLPENLLLRSHRL